MTTHRQSLSNSRGFTIVELLVVIVVIGIIAAITVVAYTGISQKAIASSLESDLRNGSNKLKMYQVENGSFPSSLDETEPGSNTYCPTPADTRYCLKASPGNELAYSSPSPYSTFTLDATHSASSVTYRITNDTPPTPVSAPAALYWLQIANGKNHSCAISSDNLAYCWGRSNNGQLGNNPTAESHVPVAVDTSGVLNGKTIKSISTGYYSTCAIASDDQAYCWGYNTTGQLGDNSTTRRDTPVAVDTSGVLNGKTVKAISVGDSHTCAIASDDQVYCWGSNNNGRLGDNSTTQSLVPVAVDNSGALSGKTVKSISLGFDNTCAIASDDQAYCWGLNDVGQLGDNSTTERLVPTAVDASGVLSGKTIKAISARSSFTCAIASDDQAYCWGSGTLGRLGNNSTSDSLVPVAVYTSGVLSGKTVKAISVGYDYACAIASDDQSYCWGENPGGVFGDNSQTQSNVPTPTDTSGVLSGKTIKSLVTGKIHTCAIASDNQAYCWGNNTYGNLGDNTIIQSTVPVAVTPL